MDEMGIGLVNVGSVSFEYIASLFSEERIKRTCAIVTDEDIQIVETDSTLFDEATVKSQAEKVIGYINADDYESLQDVSADKMKEIMTEERLSEAKEKVSDDWGAFKSMGDISTTTISKRGVNAAVAYVTATYENVEIHYTLAFDEDMKLASFGMQ